MQTANNTEISDSAVRLIWPEVVRAARDVLDDTYLSAGGVETRKRHSDKHMERVILYTLVRAAWLLSGRTHTPQYWQTRAMSEAQTKVT